MPWKHTFSILALIFLLGSTNPEHAVGQCILANPSFEVLGSGGPVFGGWNQFGSIGSSSQASHGNLAARVSGPNYGEESVSGFWQNLDSEPGEQWEVTGHVLVPSGKPLTGQSRALVNVEWRNSTGQLIDYDSFIVASASTPADEFLDFSLLSGPAPAETASTLLIIGLFQSPGEPSPDVIFDQVTFFSTTSPTIDDKQWTDFPGGNSFSFGDHTWRIKGPGYYGPGPNLFCDDSGCVWIDAQNRLHLTLQKRGSSWFSTEVTTEEALGYGDYILTTRGKLDLLDPQAVLGIFLWEYGPCWDYSYTWWNAFNEIDIEYSYWGNPSSELGQFVAQPYDYWGNISRFDASFSEGEVTSHAMRWLADRVEFRVWRGGPDEESEANMIHSWTYTGPHIPRPEQPRMHLNLWKLAEEPAVNQEVVFEDFTFIPDNDLSNVSVGSEERIPAVPPGRLLPAVPNPFNPQTVVQFDLGRDGYTELEVFDMSGRRVRILVCEFLKAGEHNATWDGRDERGQRLASGVYLLRLQGIDYVQTRRVALIK
jgi:FlgD Ig-like domain